MILTTQHYDKARAAIAARGFDPELDAARIELRPSSAGNYLGITLFVNATSREQLDALYRALSAHPLAKVVL